MKDYNGDDKKKKPQMAKKPKSTMSSTMDMMKKAPMIGKKKK